jgi:hypothetical protein
MAGDAPGELPSRLLGLAAAVLLLVRQSGRLLEADIVRHPEDSPAALWVCPGLAQVALWRNVTSTLDSAVPDEGGNLAPTDQEPGNPAKDKQPSQFRYVYPGGGDQPVKHIILPIGIVDGGEGEP